MNRKTLMAACLMLAAGVSLAAPTRPRFNPKDAVRRVAGAQGRQGSAPAHGLPRPGHDSKSREDVGHVPSDWGEFLIDTNPKCAPAQGDQESPAIAFDGTNFLVVWQDDRNGGYDIYAARVTPEGAVVDTSGIAVCTITWDQAWPAVAFDGTNFLVVWHDLRGGDYYDIYAARVTRDGVVLDPSGIAVSTAVYDQSFPAVESDGANFLVVWEDMRGDEFNDIYCARVTGAGAVLDPAGIAVSKVVFDQMYPAVATDGTNWLIVWQDERNGLGDVYGARVTGAGTVLDTMGIAVSTAPDDQGGPGVAFDGANFLVVWQDARSGGCYDTYAARVTGAGSVLDPNGIAVSTAADDQMWPSVAFDGTNFDVVWEDWREAVSGDIYCTRVSGAGVVLDPNGIAVSRNADNEGYPRVASGGPGFLVAWGDGRGESFDVYGARVTGAGVVLDTAGIALSTATNDQWFPAVAFDGTNYLVVWQDGRGGAFDIYGTRVTQAGAVLDSVAIAISTATGVQKDVAVTFGGTDYMVVWEDNRSSPTLDIYGARVSRAGVVLDPSGIAICTAETDQFEPSLAYDGANFLVAWHDYRSGRGPDIYAARVTSTGSVLEPAGIGIRTASGPQRYTATAFDGTNFLVCWQDESNTYDIYCARVSTAGVVLDPSGIAISRAAHDQQNSTVAFDGTGFLVAWLDSRRASWTDIYGARVSPAGIVLDTAGIPICTSDYDQWYPKMTFDGANFIVTWTDGRSGACTDIYGARVTPGGTVIDNFPVVTGDGSQWSADLCAAPGGQVLLAFGGWTGSVAGRTYNTYRIWGKFGPFPAVAERPGVDLAACEYGMTILHDVLFLPPAIGREASNVLLDISGSQVMSLHPGRNDVGHLPSGVYFVNGTGTSSVRKVVLAH